MSLIRVVWLSVADQVYDGASAKVAEHVSEVSSLAGVVQAGGYSVVSGGEAMKELAEGLHRLDMGPEFHYTPPSYFLVTEIETLEDAFRLEPRFAALSELAPRVGLRVLLRALYAPISYVAGPEDHEDRTLSPVVQCGTFSVVAPDDEWDLLDWYEVHKMARFREIPGGVRARRLVSVAGPTKFGVIYEFGTLEDRERRFEGEEALGLDTSHPYGRMVERIRHAPMSPTVGERFV
jgi:hypothetical protein